MGEDRRLRRGRRRRHGRSSIRHWTAAVVLNLTTVEDTIMKRLFATVLALAVLALGSGARLLAHEGHEHKVMGTVTMAAADHVMLKDKDGKDVTVKVTKDTKVKAKPAVKVEEIKVGTRDRHHRRRRERQEHDGEVHRGRRSRSGDEVTFA